MNVDIKRTPQEKRSIVVNGNDKRIVTVTHTIRRKRSA